MAGRDRGRFADARARLNESPLGAGALAGTSFPIDRAMTAKALGFARPMANSLDAVADRDFVLETLSACAIAAVHLSRFAEEIVIWSSPLAGLVRLSDKFTTGSSMMPQKRNPDAAELVRAKTGRIVGALDGALGGDQGIAARLSEGSARGQGRRDRRDRRAGVVARRDDRHGARPRARRGADEGKSPARAIRPPPISPTGSPARSSCRSATPITSPAGSSPRRPRPACRSTSCRSKPCRRSSQDHRQDHQGGVRGAVGRQVGEKPRGLWRHGAEQCPPRGQTLAQAADEKGISVWQRLCGDA